ncbi:MAG: hypothetical protein M1837_001214 [Sclerophora amabilis]|nr:MAG: hypothetical protein M1837_001214 [Sclerophora amabilis]
MANLNATQGSRGSPLTPASMTPASEAPPSYGQVEPSLPFPLLALPTKVKETIYLYVMNPTLTCSIWRLPNPVTRSAWYSDNDPMHSDRDMQRRARSVSPPAEDSTYDPHFFVEELVDMSLFRVCKGIYTDARTAFYHFTTFRFRRTPDLYFFLVNFPCHLREQIRLIELNHTPSELDEPLTPLLECEGLETLTLGLHPRTLVDQSQLHIFRDISNTVNITFQDAFIYSNPLIKGYSAYPVHRYELVEDQGELEQHIREGIYEDVELSLEEIDEQITGGTDGENEGEIEQEEEKEKEGFEEESVEEIEEDEGGEESEEGDDEEGEEEEEDVDDDEDEDVCPGDDGSEWEGESDDGGEEQNQDENPEPPDWTDFLQSDDDEPEGPDNADIEDAPMGQSNFVPETVLEDANGMLADLTGGAYQQDYSFPPGSAAAYFVDQVYAGMERLVQRWGVYLGDVGDGAEREGGDEGEEGGQGDVGEGAESEGVDRGEEGDQGDEEDEDVEKDEEDEEGEGDGEDGEGEENESSHDDEDDDGDGEYIDDEEDDASDDEPPPRKIRKLA